MYYIYDWVILLYDSSLGCCNDYEGQDMIRRDLESAASDIAKKMEDRAAREVVMALAGNDILLQGGHYLTEEELQAERDFMRNYRFQYLPE